MSHAGTHSPKLQVNKRQLTTPVQRSVKQLSKSMSKQETVAELKRLLPKTDEKQELSEVRRFSNMYVYFRLNILKFAVLVCVSITIVNKNHAFSHFLPPVGFGREDDRLHHLSGANAHSKQWRGTLNTIACTHHSAWGITGSDSCEI